MKRGSFMEPLFFDRLTVLLCRSAQSFVLGDGRRLKAPEFK